MDGQDGQDWGGWGGVLYWREFEAWRWFDDYGERRGPDFAGFYH